MVSEITPLMIITKLEQYDYAGATAIAAVMLVVSFVLLLIINALQAWTARAQREGHADGRRAQRTSRLRQRAAASKRARRRAIPPLGQMASFSASRSAFFALFLLLPLVAVFVEAFAQGLGRLLSQR